MKDFSANDFEIVRFFSYTSTIPCNDRTFDYDGMNRWKKIPNIVEKFDQFLFDISEKARLTWLEKSGDNHWGIFNDNKTVFQLKNKKNGKVFFIGHYDGYRFIGNSCHLYEGYVYDFTTFRQTGWIENVICNQSGIWCPLKF